MNPKPTLRLLLSVSAVVLTAAGGALACGPSFQAIYEGNSRFEHCYALEESAHAPMKEKVDCWRDWSERYTFGQTRDRIHYATARYVALSQSSNAPTDENMMMAAPGMTPRLSTITAPAPTNAFAPPPKVLEDDAYVDAGPTTPLRPSERPVVLGPGGRTNDAGALTAEPSPPLPGADCSAICENTFRTCKATCDTADGGARAAKDKDAACVACEKTYRTCMRGCFK